MSKQAIDYLKENKNKYPQEQLIKALKENGYSDRDIKKSVEEVYGEKAVFQFNFWDFKHKAVYTGKRDKWFDFLFGFFGTLIVAIISSFLSFWGWFLFAIIFILALIFTFNKRKYFFYGLLCFLVLPIAILVALFLLGVLISSNF